MDGVEWMDGYPLDCYDYQSTYGANNMLANPIVTFLTTDIPQAWVQVNPFFGVTADYHIYSFFSQLFFFWLFLHNVFGAFFSQFIVSAPFFTIGLFGLDQSARCFLHSCEKDLKKTLNMTMHCVPSACGFMENHL